MRNIINFVRIKKKRRIIHFVENKKRRNRKNLIRECENRIMGEIWNNIIRPNTDVFVYGAMFKISQDTMYRYLYS